MDLNAKIEEESDAGILPVTHSERIIHPQRSHKRINRLGSNPVADSQRGKKNASWSFECELAS